MNIKTIQLILIALAIILICQITSTSPNVQAADSVTTVVDIEMNDKVRIPVEVKPPPYPYPVKIGLIRPLIWRYSLNDTSCTLPLADIEAVSLQNYIVDGKIEVTETTAALKSSSFIRFYFITNAPGSGILDDRAKRVADKMEESTEKYGQIPNATPIIQSRSNQKVIKNYPITTHAHMMEHRVLDRKQVYEIYDSLDQTILEFKSFPLAPEQRSKTLRQYPYVKSLH